MQQTAPRRSGSTRVAAALSSSRIEIRINACAQTPTVHPRFLAAHHPIAALGLSEARPAAARCCEARSLEAFGLPAGDQCPAGSSFRVVPPEMPLVGFCLCLQGFAAGPLPFGAQLRNIIFSRRPSRSKQHPHPLLFVFHQSPAPHLTTSSVSSSLAANYIHIILHCIHEFPPCSSLGLPPGTCNLSGIVLIYSPSVQVMILLHTLYSPLSDKMLQI